MNMNIHFRTKGIPGRYPPGQFTTDSIREHIRDLFPTGLVGQYPTAPLDMSDTEGSGPAGSDPAQPKVKDQRIPLRVVSGQHMRQSSLRRCGRAISRSAASAATIRIPSTRCDGSTC